MENNTSYIGYNILETSDRIVDIGNLAQLSVLCDQHHIPVEI